MRNERGAENRSMIRHAARLMHTTRHVWPNNTVRAGGHADSDFRDEQITVVYEVLPRKSCFLHATKDAHPKYQLTSVVLLSADFVCSPPSRSDWSVAVRSWSESDWTSFEMPKSAILHLRLCLSSRTFGLCGLAWRRPDGTARGRRRSIGARDKWGDRAGGVVENAPSNLGGSIFARAESACRRQCHVRTAIVSTTAADLCSITPCSTRHLTAEAAVPQETTRWERG